MTTTIDETEYRQHPAYRQTLVALRDIVTAFDGDEREWQFAMRRLTCLSCRDDQHPQHVYYTLSVAEFANTVTDDFWFIVAAGEPSQQARAKWLLLFIQNEANHTLRKANDQHEI